MSEAPSGSSLWKAAAHYLGGAVGVQIVNFGVQLIFPALITPAEYGISANYVFWMTLFGLLIGMQVSGTLNNAVTRLGTIELDNYAASVIPASLVATGVLLSIALLLGERGGDALGLPKGYVVLAIINGAGVAVVNHFSARAMATTLSTAYLRLQAVSVLGSAGVGVGLAAVMSDGALGRILGYFITYTLLAALLVWRLARRPHRRVSRYLTFGLGLALPLLIHEVVFLLTTQSNRVFALNLLGHAEAGIFSFAFMVGNIAIVVATAINGAWTPYYYAGTASGADVSTRRMALHLVIGFGATLGAVVLVSPELFRLVAPESYRPGAVLVPLFVASGVLTLLFNITTNYIVYLQRTRYLLLTAFVGCLLSVSLNLVLLPRIGILGGAVATIVASGSMALLSLIICVRVLGCRNLPIGALLGAALGIVAVAALTVLLEGVPAMRWGLALLTAGLTGLWMWRALRDRLRSYRQEPFPG